MNDIPVERGGFGGHDPRMEARVARLEDQFGRIESLLKSIDDRVRKVEIDVAELRGRLLAMPTTWAMVTAVVGGQVAFMGVMIALLRMFRLQ